MAIHTVTSQYGRNAMFLGSSRTSLNNPSVGSATILVSLVLDRRAKRSSLSHLRSLRNVEIAVSHSRHLTLFSIISSYSTHSHPCITRRKRNTRSIGVHPSAVQDPPSRTYSSISPLLL